MHRSDEDTSAKEIRKWGAWEEREEDNTDVCDEHAGAWRKHTVASKRRSPLLLSKVCAFYKESNKVSQLGGFLSPPQTVCLGKPEGNTCLRLSFILRQYKVSSEDESQAQGGAESCLRGSQQDPQIIKIKMGINSILCIDSGEFSAVLHYFCRKGTEEGALRPGMEEKAPAVSTASFETQSYHTAGLF